MTATDWEALAVSLHASDGTHGVPLAGVDLAEVLALMEVPWDDVDRLLIDAETMGA